MAKKKSTSSQKLYRNAGVSTLAFEGQEFEPGSEFRATLEPEHEMQLITGGHIEILEDQSADADRAQAEAAERGESTTGAVTENEAGGKPRRPARS